MTESGLTPSLFHIKNLTKSFTQEERKITALDKISFTVQKGDIYGVIGPSGAGKSTLIRSLARLNRPDSGQIIYQGTDIASIETREFYQSIGMIFQHFNLMSGRTVSENIAYPLEVANWKPAEIQKRVDELLGFVGLLEKRDSYPSMLSGGEKQRVGIARALANKAKTLLCDEATSALDPKTRNEILKLLKSVKDEMGVTIVLITHDMEVIKAICNKMAVIEKGKIVEEGNVEDIFTEPKHPITKKLIQKTSHEIPEEFFSRHQKLYRLRFKGKAASEPLISQIVKQFNVEANILLGWIDKLQTTIVGTLIVELVGNEEQAIQFLRQKNVNCEIVENGK